MELTPLLKGALTFVPGLYRPGANAEGGSIAGRYCYTVWGRHLARWQAVGFDAVPGVVAELGPGLSFGVGLAALLAGAREYLALDVARDASPEVNHRLVDELGALFRARTPLPGATEFPRVLPAPAGEPRWPAFDEARIRAVHRALDGESSDMSIHYQVPWHDGAPSTGLADVVIAQAVMEHVTAPRDVYAAIRRLLRPGGLFSFTVDFTSHGLTRAWNGHLAYAPSMWRVVRGTRRWTVNRLPLAAHLAALGDAGFEVVQAEREYGDGGIGRDAIAPALPPYSSEDHRTSGAYVLARARR
jgi:SAM-dependent methyltransferase